jgi:hypothetical protein
MHLMHHPGLRLLIAAFLSLAVVSPAVTSAAGSVERTTRPAGAAKRTSLTLRVHGCDGCKIQPVKAGDGSQSALWRGKKKTVRNGVVRWSVTQRHTHGMSFDIVDPHAVALDFMTDIVMAYRGLAVGARVEAGVAKHKKRANACWAGTHRASVTLRVRVEQFPSMSDFPPSVPGYQIRPYAVRTKPFVRLFDGKGGTYSRASKGVTGNQDAYFCGGSVVRHRDR